MNKSIYYRFSICECGKKFSDCAVWVDKNKCICSNCKKDITKIILESKDGVCPCCHRKLLAK